MVSILATFLMVAGFTAVSSRNSGLSVISQCICPGYNVIYECSVSGIGRTIWTGTAFSNCPSNRIILRHSQFSSPGGASGTCNFGAIVGRSIGVQDTDCYISQLDVLVTSNTVGTTIICSHDNGSAEVVEVGSSTLMTTINPLPPPSNVMLTRVNPSQLTFSWDPVGSDCLAIKYSILAENCGSCPIKSNTTTATCTNPQPQPNPGITCTFRVQTEVCEGVIGGGASDPSTARLRVPDTPVINVIPTYSQSEKTLTSISVRIMEMDSFFISNEIDGSTTSYTIIYTNSTSGDVCDSDVIPVSECTNGVCNGASKFDDLSSQSPCSSTELSVKVFATNILGDSEESDMVTVDPSNNFVDLSYDMTSNSIICIFMNPSEKSCSIVYRVCEQEQVTGTVQENSTGNNNMVVLMLGNLQEATYCYVVTAKNRTFTVNINGRIDLRNPSSQANTGAIVGGVLGATVAIVILILAVIGAVVFYYKKRYLLKSDDNIDYSEPDKLIPVNKKRFKVLKVERKCTLAEFIEQKKLAFQSGRVFYEFTRKEEDINSEKEVILMDKSKNLYTGNKACKMIGAPGQRIPNPKLENYDVFVQSMGIGYRPLEADSRILYDHEHRKRSQSSHPKRELIPVDPERFTVINVDEGGELVEIVEKQNLPFKPGCAFFEFMNEQEDIEEKKEVILMDKTTGDMFTGPAAHFMIGAPGREIDRPDLKKFRVFVQSLFKGSRYIHGNTLLLYEEPASDSDTLDTIKPGRFKVFNVDKDCSLRSFVEKVCGLKYEARRFFFEFVSREEEITEDKEIILMDKDTNEMFTGLKAKEMIGAPAKVVKRPTPEQYRVFVQNGGAGTQCLRARTSLLYEVKYDY